MNTTYSENLPDEQTQTLDQTLTEIRSGRRLESIVSSIESFLNGQVERLEKAVDDCNRSVENDKIVQRIKAEFELEKQEWEQQRQSEIIRLSTAGNELATGWEQLELERRKLAN